MSVTDLLAVYVVCLVAGGFTGLLQLAGKQGR